MTPSVAGGQISVYDKSSILKSRISTVYVDRHIPIHIGGSSELASVYQRIAGRTKYSTGKTMFLNIFIA